VILTWVPNVVSYQQLCSVRDTCIGGKLSANFDNVHTTWSSVINLLVIGLLYKHNPMVAGINIQILPRPPMALPHAGALALLMEQWYAQSLSCSKVVTKSLAMHPT